MDPLEFLECASRLIKGATPTEGDRRSAVSRAYYAVFNRVESWLLAAVGPWPRPNAKHFEMVSELSGSRHKGAQLIGVELSNCKTARTNADYLNEGDGVIPLDPTTAASQVLNAERLFTAWGTIEASPGDLAAKLKANRVVQAKFRR